MTDSVTNPDLRLRRLAPLHKQFCEAAEQFPELGHAVAGTHDDASGWPLVPCRGGDDHLGLTTSDWRSLLQKPNHWPFTSLNSHWMKIDGELWERAFHGMGQLWTDTHAQHEDLLEGISEFQRLAGIAAGQFDVQPTPHQLVDRPLQPEPMHRWIELLYSLPLFECDDRDAFRCRRLKGNVFQASARAIEVMEASDNTRSVEAIANIRHDDLSIHNAEKSGTADIRGVFKKVGDTWTLGFQSREQPGVSDQKALADIQILLRRPDERVDILDLPGNVGAAEQTGEVEVASKYDGMKY